MTLTKYIKTFLANEKSAGIILVLCTVFSLLMANSPFGLSYHHFWQIPIANEHIEYWINDGLMSIFFLLVGLELKQAFLDGPLSNIKDATLPIYGAIGGMLIPAGIYLLINLGTDTQSGSGIPMATDIAFSLGILSLLGKRIPNSLKIFLTALAVIDDLGAIIVIGIFYTTSLNLLNLFFAFGIFSLLLVFKKCKIDNLIIYIIGGIAMWYFMLHSGIHATITGVLLAIAMPYEKGILVQKQLHNPVTFIILPIFALANTAIYFTSNFQQLITEKYSIGIALGLIIGKPLGIVLFTFLGTVFKLCQLPKDLNWSHILGVGFLAGIGFTMSIFITLLAFKNEIIINNAKLIVVISSVVAALIGLTILKVSLKRDLNTSSTIAQ